MINTNKLNIGDASDNGQVTIIDEDRLCYLVKSTSRGAYGLRTISKSLLSEYVEYFAKKPDASANDARDALCGNTDIDKFEYGYTSTLKTMAQMVLGQVSIISATLKSVTKPQKHPIFPLQTIFYGAPGTGKSYKVKSEKLAGVPEENIFRTTFHPDYDYASFVGCYKPTKEDDKITYSFIPQVFTKAYIKAWEEMKQENPQPVYLVIEEINRGNCAQIFGDLFQLLDRNENGYSEYPIDIDEDLKNYLVQQLGADSEGIKDGKLCLPPNLNLLATMNTSDQSLFPMDSAFKRRWDWEFVPIRYSATEAKDDKDNFHTFEIKIGNKKYKWTDFLEKVNAKILSVTDSEDKQMGEYFIKKSVDEKTFINKVMYYLWSEVGKDLYGSTNPFFVQKTKNENGQDVENQFSFNDLFKGNATELLQGFMKKLEVPEVNIEDEKAAATEAGEE